MSLLDFGIEEGIRVPDAREMMIADNHGIGEFLRGLDRDVGLIPASEARRYVLSEIGDSQRRVLHALGTISTLNRLDQIHKFKVQVALGHTEAGDRTYCVLPPRHGLVPGTYSADTLIATEGDILFGHYHRFRGGYERLIGPLTQPAASAINVLAHQATVKLGL